MTFPTLSSGSMKVYSPLLDQAIAMYPAMLTHSVITRVIKFANDTEQRWSVRPELFSATLQYSAVNGYDLALIQAFFRTMRGEYVDTLMLNVFDITIDGVQYFWCVFDQDSISPESEIGETYSFVLNIKQLRPN